MILKTLVIDDEPIALEKLKTYVGKIPFLQLTASADNPLDATKHIVRNDIDLIITDIEMPDLSGMEFIESLSSRPIVVFTTAYPQYAVDSYKVAAVDYLLKPYSFSDFQRAANRALAAAQARTTKDNEQAKSIFIKTDSRYIRINTADITYIKGYGEYLQIFVKQEKMPLLTLSSFASMINKLPGEFIQVHRSYIVNMDNVDIIERNRITVDRQTVIPVSDSFREAFNSYLSKYSVGKNSR